jgi:hypothetical protein
MVHCLQGGEKRLTLRLRSHRLPLAVDCRPSTLETLLGTLGLAGEVQAPNDKQAWAVSTVGSGRTAALRPPEDFKERGGTRCTPLVSISRSPASTRR